MSEMSGGCMCGRVRFTAEIDSPDAYLCHCRMCQRASGSVSIAFKNLRKAAVRWERAPDLYASSPIAERGHCATCGTTLSFAFPDSGNMDLTVAAFDEPGFFVPKHHFGIESRLEAWRRTDHLPGYRADEHPATVERWMATVGRLPE